MRPHGPAQALERWKEDGIIIDKHLKVGRKLPTVATRTVLSRHSRESGSRCVVKRVVGSCAGAPVSGKLSHCAVLRCENCNPAHGLLQRLGAPAFDLFRILIANTSSYAGTARVTLYLEDGQTLQQDVPLKAKSRTNVSVGAPTDFFGFGDAVKDKRFGSSIESLPVAGEAGPAQIVVERSMYTNGPGAAFWAAGTDVLAARIR